MSKMPAGIGFASTNISDVTLARASRITPAVTAAQAALNDAMASRDRECKGGVGKFCREREVEVLQDAQELARRAPSERQRARHRRYECSLVGVPADAASMIRSLGGYSDELADIRARVMCRHRMACRARMVARMGRVYE